MVSPEKGLSRCISCKVSASIATASESSIQPMVARPEAQRVALGLSDHPHVGEHERRALKRRQGPKHHDLELEVGLVA